MKLSELKEIREALNLSQAEMGMLFGVKQGVYQRWEVTPSSPTAKDATLKAVEIYRKKKGKAWTASIGTTPTIEALTREEFAEWRGYWKAGTEKLLERLEDLTRRVDELEKRALK